MAKLTAADLIAAKGQRKLVLTTAFDEYTAYAAEAAGVDMILAWGDDLDQSRWIVDRVRKGAPDTAIGTGLPSIGAYSSEAEALRLAGELTSAGVDVIYCSGLVPDKFAALSRQRYPCCGHVGYLPVQNTWFGKPRAVGKTADEAVRIYRDTVALQQAGVLGVEMECVPAKVAAEITRRVDILTFSLGSGPDCDGQFLFAEDLLGTNRGHYPRHSKTYVRLLDQAIDAMKRYRDDVVDGRYPSTDHCIAVEDGEFERFLQDIEEPQR